MEKLELITKILNLKFYDLNGLVELIQNYPDKVTGHIEEHVNDFKKEIERLNNLDNEKLNEELNLVTEYKLRLKQDMDRVENENEDISLSIRQTKFGNHKKTPLLDNCIDELIKKHPKAENKELLKLFDKSNISVKIDNKLDIFEWKEKNNHPHTITIRTLYNHFTQARKRIKNQ